MRTIVVRIEYNLFEIILCLELQLLRGTSQFPNPPIMIGITIKRIIMNAWAVTITL